MQIKPHKNAVIGIKKLSDADLGRSKSSNQTHIGLFENTLLCIDDLHLVDYCYLVTEKKTSKLLCLLDYIKNTDGTFRSPKIRKGADRELFFENQELNSVVREIRQVAHFYGSKSDWYLLWFATDNQHLVFALFEFRSKFFNLLSTKIDGINKREQHSSNNESFFKIIDTITPYLNNEL